MSQPLFSLLIMSAHSQLPAVTSACKAGSLDSSCCRSGSYRHQTGIVLSHASKQVSMINYFRAQQFVCLFLSRCVGLVWSCLRCSPFPYCRIRELAWNEPIGTLRRWGSLEQSDPLTTQLFSISALDPTCRGWAKWLLSLFDYYCYWTF